MVGQLFQMKDAMSRVQNRWNTVFAVVTREKLVCTAHLASHWFSNIIVLYNLHANQINSYMKYWIKKKIDLKTNEHILIKLKLSS